MTDPVAKSPPYALLLSDDLIFISRIAGEARAAGVAVQSARNVEAAIGKARQHRPACVLVDLGNPGLVLTELLASLDEACTPRPRVVAYGSHVDAEGLKAARAAGCDPVLPRSKFVEELPRAIAGWASDEGDLRR